MKTWIASYLLCDSFYSHQAEGFKYSHYSFFFTKKNPSKIMLFLSTRLPLSSRFRTIQWWNWWQRKLISLPTLHLCRDGAFPGGTWTSLSGSAGNLEESSVAHFDQFARHFTVQGRSNLQSRGALWSPSTLRCSGDGCGQECFFHLELVCQLSLFLV